MIYSLDRNKYKIVQQYDVYNLLKQKQKEGLIGHLGFSFHDTPELLRKILEDHQWDFCQIQLNYLDWTYQTAKEQYEIISEKGLKCVVMEPVRGGDLNALPAQAEALLRERHPDDSLPSWAIRFVSGLSNVLCVLSGMSDFNMLHDNIETVSHLITLSEWLPKPFHVPVAVTVPFVRRESIFHRSSAHLQ